MCKRLFSLLLVLALVLPTALTVKGEEVSKEEIIKQISNTSHIEKIQEAESLANDKEVRIIVELKEKPALESFYSVARAVMNIQKFQKNLKNKIKSKNINIDYHHDFTRVVNGFSGTTTLGEAKRIETLPEVKRVYLANEYTAPRPNIIETSEYIGLGKALSYDGKYTGEGTVVSIIDTGIDYLHKDMRLTDDETAKLSKDEVESTIQAKDLVGRYYSVKVPYGYNYFDKNDEIKDLGTDASMHGMHVGGTVGGNGPEVNGVKGVAPEAQLLAMKVFGNNPEMPSTFGDMIIAAIDDSIALGADVINMSLGSTSGFVDDNDLEQDAVRRATESGVICAIAAGNSGFFNSPSPSVENMDTALVGAPGLAPSAIQVASMENSKVHSKLMYFGQEKATYLPAGPHDPVDTFNKEELEVVYCGIGGKDDIGDVYGKVALIERGGMPFSEKINNAYEQGAIGVIVYNHTQGGDALQGMGGTDGIKIPAIFIGHNNGEKLKASGEKVIMTGEMAIEVNPNAGEMSSFSSWGPVSTLDLKPEITAPGGKIYSTLNDDKYGMMSGTSMATPHVSGVMALLTQRINAEYPELKGVDKVNFAKNLLMSSAKIQLDSVETDIPYKTYITPRQQGAGLANVYNAVATTIMMMDPKSGEVEVDLHEIEDQVTFKVVVKNLKNYPIKGILNGTIQAPYIKDGHITVHDTPIYTKNAKKNAYLPMQIDGDNVNIKKGKFLLVPAGGEVELEVSFNLKDARVLVDNELKPLKEVYPKGTYIEGYITYTDRNDNFHIASIPYLGYYGEWDQLPILDVTKNEANQSSVFGIAGFLDQNLSLDKYLGENGEEIIVGNMNNNASSKMVHYLPSFLRNSKDFKLEVLDSSKKPVKTLAVKKDIRKSHAGKHFHYDPDFNWDLTVNNQVAPEGQYYLRATAKIDFDGAIDQVYDYPVYVDHSLSKVLDTKIYGLKPTLEIIAKAEGKGIKGYALFCLDANGDVMRFDQDTPIFEMDQIKDELPDGDYQLYPAVISKNNAIDIGAPVQEALALATGKAELDDEIDRVSFTDTIVNLNMAAGEDEKTISIEEYHGLKKDYHTKVSTPGDMNKVVFTTIDGEAIAFKDQVTIKAVQKGKTDIQAIYVTNEILLEALKASKDETMNANFVNNPDLSGYAEGKDYFNVSMKAIIFNTEEPTDSKDNDVHPPAVHITNVKYGETINKVDEENGSYYKTLEGKVEDVSGIKSLIIDGQDITDQLTYNAKEQNWTFTFKHQVYDHSVEEVKVSIEDMAGNKVDFIHKFFVDFSEATIDVFNVGAIVVEHDGAYYYVYPSIEIDSFIPSYNVYVNGELVASVDKDYRSYEEYLYEDHSTILADFEVPVVLGKNNIEIKVVDGAGNTAVFTQEIEIKN